jgi:hypothetical protein
MDAGTGIILRGSSFCVDLLVLSTQDLTLTSTEKPLSDLVLLSFRSYWTQVPLTLAPCFFLTGTGAAPDIECTRGNVSVAEISAMTSIKTDDIISTIPLLLSPALTLSHPSPDTKQATWLQVLLQTLSTHRGNVSVAKISAMTSIKTDDIISTLPLPYQAKDNPD